MKTYCMDCGAEKKTTESLRCGSCASSKSQLGGKRPGNGSKPGVKTGSLLVQAQAAILKATRSPAHNQYTEERKAKLSKSLKLAYQEGRHTNVRGICPMCGREGIVHKDHNHNTGRHRGIICHRCNLAIGLLGDSIDTVAKVLEYLRENV